MKSNYEWWRNISRSFLLEISRAAVGHYSYSLFISVKIKVNFYEMVFYKSFQGKIKNFHLHVNSYAWQYRSPHCAWRQLGITSKFLQDVFQCKIKRQGFYCQLVTMVWTGSPHLYQKVNILPGCSPMRNFHALNASRWFPHRCLLVVTINRIVVVRWSGQLLLWLPHENNL